MAPHGAATNSPKGAMLGGPFPPALAVAGTHRILCLAKTPCVRRINDLEVHLRSALFAMIP